jgi:DNA-binding CsgD family transcriptional regulator
MKTKSIDARSQALLELLAQGASARIMARKLGYSEGTTRVYLHNLYKAIGVRNKTQAVIWHLGRAHAAIPAAVATAPAVAQSRECFGEMALAEGLYAALGVMSTFLGPYGHVWEAGMRMKGSQADEKLLARRIQSRLLWRALLQGDFAYGKGLHDDASGERIAFDSPSDGVLLACLLLIGGYSSAADGLVAQLSSKRKAGANARELALLRAVRASLGGEADSAIASLHQLATENARAPILRQLAMIALYYVYKGRRDTERACATASAIWADAEAGRQQLEAMGVRPLGRDAALPRPAKSGAREPAAAREKAAVTR